MRPLLGLELDEQVEDRRLDRDVERARRLVADDEPRVAGERARDRDALLEPAGELTGFCVSVRSVIRTRDVEVLRVRRLVARDARRAS